MFVRWHWYCVGVNMHEALQATVSEGLVQGLYVSARVGGFEPAALRMQGIKLTIEPPCPT